MSPPGLTRCRLPTELLHRVIVLVITEHIDDLIAGSMRFPSLDEHSTATDEELVLLGRELSDAQDEETKRILDAPNPVSNLLCTSYQIRDLTLTSLSSILGIPLVKDERGKRCVTFVFYSGDVLNAACVPVSRPVRGTPGFTQYA